MRTEVEITRMGLEGQGVGYDPLGNIYFVPGTVPGDRVEVEHEEETKKYRDAVAIEIKSLSPNRRDPKCTVFGECGGCDYLHWQYPSQLIAKKSTLAHAIERAGWDPLLVKDVLPSPKEFGYRNRIQVRREAGKTGFYKRGTNELVDVEHCLVANDQVNETLKAIRSTPPPALGKEKIEIAVDTNGEIQTLINQAHAAGGFQQINAEQNIQLRELVSKAVGTNAKKVLELYCGDGNLTFAYVNQVEEVMAVDSSDPAIQLARSKKKEGDKVAFMALPVDARLPRQLPSEIRKKYDTLVVDPPRQGMEGGMTPWLHPDLEKVIYISCSAISFSKDTQSLRDDFLLQSVQPLDMFPHTRHLEFVSVFVRSHLPSA